MGDVTILPAFSVTGERIEDFGFRVSAALDPKRSGFLRRVCTPTVDVVLPDTAASKAGLRPGDRIVKSDGLPAASGTFSIRKWRSIQEKKWAAFAAGRKNVTWTLEVEAEFTGALRTLVLRVPTPAPRWGDDVWQAPEDRSPAIVAELGPLAARAGQVLDNGIRVLLRASCMRGLEIPVAPDRIFFLCHQWTLWDGAAGHRIYVSQQRGRTDIILEAISKEPDAKLFSTAPAVGPVRTLESPTTIFANDPRAEFAREVDFWLTKTGRFSPRWPLSLIAGNETHPAGADATTQPSPPSGAPPCVRAEAFLKRPRANSEEHALFDDAFGKLGLDADRRAYTETSRTLHDAREIVVRVDPSKPELERQALLKIGGRTPTAEEAQRWRDEGHEPSDLGDELAAIPRMIDRDDVRVFAMRTLRSSSSCPCARARADFRRRNSRLFFA